ncbi:MAG: ATP-binding cassette domain-containing protein [Candidatus Fermentithermobacillus carboniphilus]|uniref:ATP-binding cassette domain-containing protein n=1 Tax=Candidatus Fermentithermobacillus carboniphilus TaxID=3085328 RepID=A0AAT9LDP5_9FIRM|nr:MAG: ATP-binding cassette domain-containing protein [Candidatus Fermentithermobacillus carboniphilus]
MNGTLVSAISECATPKCFSREGTRSASVSPEAPSSSDSSTSGGSVGSRPSEASPVVVAEELTRYFRVRLDGEGFLQKVSRFFKPDYRLVKALDGVSFTIHAGESVGYIGLNGAGKSTTIKILCGVLVPTSGKVTVLGVEPFRHRTENARRIGLMMGQRTQLLWDLPVRESFDLLGRIYDLRRETYRANRDRLVEALDIGDLMDTPARMLSLGQKTRCDLALTFLHDPAVVFLDEPTIGLDILAREQIRDFLRAEKKRGVTIFLASHDLDDLEIVTDRVMLIHRGRIMFDGTQEELRRVTGGTLGSLEDTVRRFYREAELG